VLKQLHLVNFRAFSDFRLSFGPGAYLVGPNNAGKSTLLTALRTADVLLRYAYRRKPDLSARDGEVSVVGYPVNLRDFPALLDSLRFEFGGAEARLELKWKSGAKLTAVWPSEDEDGESNAAFFYLSQPSSYPVLNPTQAKACFPPLGVIPILGPTEHDERLLAEDYVRQNIAGRLSSRHFRNQLRLLQQEQALEPFLEWAEPWLGDLAFDTLGQHMSDDGLILEAFFYEAGSRVPKEIVWAGDGVQVWLQLLYHVHRVRERDTIILDEPEVYLHPDLQRRLVRLLEATGRQIVVATHSSEIVAESDGRLTTLVDRTRRRASRSRSDADYEMLSTTLGTAFNLRLAKALRSRVAVFVEGHDMSLLRHFARALGLTSLEREAGVTVVPLRGYNNWGQVEPFKWLCDELLPDAIETFVILDRDYRPETVRADVMTRMAASGIRGHVWARKELESYLLTSAAIARLSGAKPETVTKWLNGITAGMESDVFGRLLDERLKAEVDGQHHAVSVTTAFKSEFDSAWASPQFRLATCPPKQVVSSLNAKLQAKGLKPVSIAALARGHRRRELASEVVDLLTQIEAAALTTT
jgi:energy-coupling factor transporter ATP-binding protein EcfA2